MQCPRPQDGGGGGGPGARSPRAAGSDASGPCAAAAAGGAGRAGPGACGAEPGVCGARRASLPSSPWGPGQPRALPGRERGGRTGSGREPCGGVGGLGPGSPRRGLTALGAGCGGEPPAAAV